MHNLLGPEVRMEMDGKGRQAGRKGEMKWDRMGWIDG